MMKKVQMTISELAELTGIHRQTVSKRLSDTQPLPGSNSKRKLYDSKLALLAIIQNRGR